MAKTSNCVNSKLKQKLWQATDKINSNIDAAEYAFKKVYDELKNGAKNE